MHKQANEKNLDAAARLEVLTEAEAAGVLRIGIPTLRKFRYRREIEFLRFGSSVRYLRRHLTDFVAQHERK